MRAGVCGRFFGGCSAAVVSEDGSGSGAVRGPVDEDSGRFFWGCVGTGVSGGGSGSGAVGGAVDEGGE
jgi:hypothetical protein